MQISLTKISERKSSSLNQDKNSPRNYASQQNWRLYSQNQQWIPATDVFETDHQVIIRLEIAGMQEDAFEIVFDKNILAISGSRIDPIEDIRVFHQMEIGFGEFFIALEINIALDLETAEATYENGYLIILVNKAKPKSIKIEK